MSQDLLPPDPFADDPNDPAKDPVAFDYAEPGEPISDLERADLLADIGDLAHYQELLEPRGFRGIVVDCGDCEEPHYHDWHLLRASLQQLLADNWVQPHEPAFAPNPAQYLTWDYCKGYADGVSATQRTG